MLEMKNSFGFDTNFDWSIKTMLYLFVCILTISAVNPLQSVIFYDEKGEMKIYSGNLYDDSIPIELDAELESKVAFILFTRKVPQAEMLTADNVAETSFNPKANTSFLIHGYLNDGRKDYLNNTAKAYLNNSDINVIVVDWGPLAITPDYHLAVKYTRIVGKVVGELITRLHQEVGLKLDNVHVVGHSLGAHTAGFTGKTVIELTGKQVSRITGLDPAGPLFEFPISVKPAKRLDKNDAKLVDVIHTDGGAYGSRKIIGHIDFFANGGLSPQPGCSGVQAHSCSHGRAFDFFTESIYNNNFVGQRCKSWEDYVNDNCEDKFSMMGEHLGSPEFGTYFLATNAESPFAKG